MERVDRASRIHRRLLKAVEEVRDAFSLQLCTDFPLLIFLLVVVTFSLISFTYATEKEVWQACECAVVILFLGGKLLLVVISCSKTSDEANEFGISLYQVPIQDSAAHNQLREYSIRIMKQKLVFTAGGVFTVDRKLAISVFSNLIKYLIIFYQLRRIY
ncbi:uncharacterized protein LOC124180887 [Neodiprion fabricii]|uniref:uncharacterized protein LOC124180887 n=1 Tax=Neodiprion fabricii TaxID=2872261 RepID=UPI001ED920A6|nr:uncharacterized protein LOC124180887 [Neodiprion fabricii]